VDAIGGPKVTVSISISQMSNHDDDAWQVVKRADAAQYNARESGRNCIIKAQ